MENNFVIFIISNSRPNNIITIKTLIEAGLTIPYYIVVDNEDNTINNYIDIYKDKVIVFDKKKYYNNIDNFNNLGVYRSTTYARNACFDIAKDLQKEYFLVLDDDYTEFKFRINKNLNHPFGFFKIKKNIDNILFDTLNYYIRTDCKSICFSQGGDWFGGEKQFGLPPKRKAMNSFFCSVNRRFDFFSTLNEDVNTYIGLGKTGNVFLTIPFIQLDQMPTQNNKGGMSDAYINSGTYTKSFYTVMLRPDCTKVSLMGRTNKRFHHLIDWSIAVPKIIDKKYKK